MTRLHFAAAQEEGEAADALFTPLRIAGFVTALLGMLTVGLFAGRELRFRYKFRRRTPSDFFSNAGDGVTGTDYGMGV